MTDHMTNSHIFCLMPYRSLMAKNILYMKSMNQVQSLALSVDLRRSHAS